MISDAGMEIKYSVAALFCRFLENFISIPVSCGIDHAGIGYS